MIQISQFDFLSKLDIYRTCLKWGNIVNSNIINTTNSFKMFKGSFSACLNFWRGSRQEPRGIKAGKVVPSRRLTEEGVYFDEKVSYDEAQFLTPRLTNFYRNVEHFMPISETKHFASFLYSYANNCHKRFEMEK